MSTTCSISFMRSSVGLDIMSVVRSSHKILFRSDFVMFFSSIHSGFLLDAGGVSRIITASIFWGAFVAVALASAG